MFFTLISLSTCKVTVLCAEQLEFSFWWGSDFHHLRYCVQTTLRPTQPPIQSEPKFSFLSVK